MLLVVHDATRISSDHLFLVHHALAKGEKTIGGQVFLNTVGKFLQPPRLLFCLQAVAKKEKRFANDGYPYTLAEFIDFYGKPRGPVMWDRAKPCIYNCLDVVTRSSKEMCVMHLLSGKSCDVHFHVAAMIAKQLRA